MTENTQAETLKTEILKTITSTKVCFLATSGQSGPETSMTPYALLGSSILIHLSALAKHSKNITKSAQVGLMVCTPESAELSPLALPRISFQGRLKPVGSEQLRTAESAYIFQIPEAEPLFSFNDFTLYQLDIKSIFWVGGFGSARKITADTWRSVCNQIR